MMPYAKTAADFSSAERDSCIEGAFAERVWCEGG